MNSYTVGAFKSLKLIKEVFDHLVEQKRTENTEKILIQLEFCEPRSSLSQKLGLDIHTDSSLEESEYWNGIRAMISLAKKQWSLLHDPNQFQQFLKNSHNSFEAKKIRIPPNQIMDPQNSRESKKNELGKGTIQKLAEYLNHFNRTVSQLPELIQDVIEKTIESKMEKELKTLKIELKNYLASELGFNYSKDSLEGETNLALNKQITKDQSSTKTIVEEVESQKEKSTTKSHIEQNDLTKISLRDALKILRDED